MHCGGRSNRLPWRCDTKVANLVTVKCLPNHIISTPGAKASCIDIKDFYLNNPLPTPKYIWFQAILIPWDIWDQYNLDKYCEDGWLYAQVDKGIYGLPQA